MTGMSGYTRSIWMPEQGLPGYTALERDAQVDVCIIGAGIAGMSAAYLLVQAGRSVIVVDDATVGGGQTGCTTAHLSNALDDRYFEIERLHGAEGARLAAQSHTAAIDRIESIVAKEQIACEFERLDGFLFAPQGESLQLLERDQQAARRAGLTDVEYVRHSPFSSFDTGPCLRFPRQAQFHPLKYLTRLAEIIVERGGRIFGNTHVQRVQGGANAQVSTHSGRVVACDAIVIATNTPANNRLVIHTKQAAYRTYVIAAPVPTGSVAKVLAWDTGDPYHYIRIETLADSVTDLLIIGGEDHKTGQVVNPEERFSRLETWMRKRFPLAGPLQYQWSGQIMEPIDALAFIGRNPMDDPNVYIVTGDSGNGLTHGTIAGMLITDLILGRENAWEKLYDPARITWQAVTDFARENLNVAAQYMHWAVGGDVNSVEDIAPGEAAIISRGLNKIAVYRDEAGVLHERSAVCPHLGCIVKWNAAEKTWDCPCHGSRYTWDGTVINGPAIGNLTTAAHAK